jgi:predicted butyrate kinase (DUF1464 family)
MTIVLFNDLKEAFSRDLIFEKVFLHVGHFEPSQHHIVNFMGNVEHVIAHRCILFKICSKESESTKDFIVMSSIFSHLSRIFTKLENKMELQLSHGRVTVLKGYLSKIFSIDWKH